jgi:hypothetical protein
VNRVYKFRKNDSDRFAKKYREIREICNMRQE